MSTFETVRPSSPVEASRTRPQDVVLVGFAEALAAPEVVWSLVDDGFQVVAFARAGRRSALRHSRHVICHDICPPEVDLERSRLELSALLRTVGGSADSGRRIVFPLDDKAVWLCNAVQLDQSWLPAGPQGGTAELALNKHLQFHAARQAGFNVPNATLANTAEDVFRFSASELFPIILKPAMAVPIQNGRLAECPKWICANPSELEAAVKSWAERVPLLVQKFIAGTGEGIFGLAVPGGIRAWSAHRRLRMMNPQGSGSSACVSEQPSEEIRKKAQRLIQDAGWQGLFMIELLRDASGDVWFVELNGRPWGSMALARRQALEYPAWQIRLAIDGDSGVGKDSRSNSGIVCRHIGRELMHILFVLKGSKTKALTNWPSFRKTMSEVFAMRSGETIYNWRRDDPAVFLADCYYTIHNNVFKARN